MTDVDQRPRLDRSALEQLLAGLTAVRGGDFSRRLAPTGDPLVDEIASVFNGMADQLDQFTSEVTRVAREVGTEGKLGGQAHVPGVSGTWKDLTESVNAMAGNLTTQVRNIAQVATAVAKGDLTQKIGVEAQGEILELKTTLNTMVDQLSAFADEVTRVAREVGTQGDLGGQAVVHGVSGHLEGPDRQRQLDGEQPDQPGAEHRPGHHRGRAGRPDQEDRRGRARRDPRAQDHHQHDGRPALRRSRPRSPGWRARSAGRASSAGRPRSRACPAPGSG